jgi:glycine hydroxymethyltransferase
MDAGARLITNGTDNHLLLIDVVRSWGLAGQEVETLFDRIGITLNKNVIPDDPRKPMDPSGIRLGTPAVTTRGMKELEMERLVAFMLHAIERRSDEADLAALHGEVKEFCRAFPVPGIG